MNVRILMTVKGNKQVEINGTYPLNRTLGNKLDDCLDAFRDSSYKTMHNHPFTVTVE